MITGRKDNRKRDRLAVASSHWTGACSPEAAWRLDWARRLPKRSPGSSRT